MHRSLRRSPLAALASIVACVALAFTLTGCAGGDGDDVTEPSLDATTSPGATENATMTPVPIAEVPEIASFTWQQSQALPDFDGSLHETDDPAEIQALREVLAAHGVVEAFTYDHGDCAGGLSTWVNYQTAAGEDVSISASSCEGETTFESALATLVTGWRTGE
ncbi:MAG: hypothetical protein ACTH31_13875 [Pseudoclavibacter sp.]